MDPNQNINPNPPPALIDLNAIDAIIAARVAEQMALQNQNQVQNPVVPVVAPIVIPPGYPTGLHEDVNQQGFLVHANVVIQAAQRNDGIIQLYQENPRLCMRTLTYLRYSEKAQYRCFLAQVVDPPTANRNGLFLGP